MRSFTRRAAVLAGLAALAPGAGRAALTQAQSAHPGYRAWDAPPGGPSVPLDQLVDTGAGMKRLADWLEGRPAVLALWASWCGPCLVEKPHQAAMSARLNTAGARARILALQAYDDMPLANARRMLTRLQASNLVNARASAGAEAGFIRMFGASSRDRTRTAMPSLLLLDARGRELGRAVGTMTGVDGATDYWEDEASFEFLRGL